MTTRQNNVIKDFGGFTNRELTPKTIRAQKITTKRLSVTENAEIQELDVDSVNVSQINLNGQFNSTSTSVFDLNGLIKINQANYVLTVTQLEQALADAAITGGSSVILAPGTFFISEPLIVPANTDIIGSGPNTTIIKTRDGFAASPSAAMYISGGNNSIQNLQIDGNNGRTRLIDITACSNVSLRNLELKKSSGAFVTARNSASNVNVTNLNCLTKLDSSESVFQVNSGTSDSFFTNLNVDTVTQTLGTVTSFNDIGSAIFTIADSDPNDATAAVGNTNGITISNLVVNNCTTEKFGIHISQYSSGVISRITFTDISFFDSSVGFGMVNAIGSTTFLLENISFQSFQYINSVISDTSGGFYRITNCNSVNITNLRSDGIFSSGSGGGVAIISDTLTTRDITISSLNLISNSVVNGTGIFLFTTNSGGIQNVTVQNCLVENYARGISGAGLTNCININIIGTIIRKPSDGGFLLDEVEQLTIDNCKIEEQLRAGAFGITDSSDILIKNSTFIGTSNTSVSSGTLCSVSRCENFVIEACKFIGNVTARIVLDSSLTSNLFVTNCIFTGNTTNKLIEMDRCTNATLSGSRFILGGEGIKSESSNCVILSENIISDTANGIFFNNCIKSSVLSNTIKNSSFNGIYLNSFEGQVRGNMLYSSNSNINLASNTNVVILDNKASSNISSNVTVNGYNSEIFGNASASTVYLTLPDVISQAAGHLLRFESVDTGNVYITPTSPGNDLISLASYTSNVHLNASGEFAVFQWSGTDWNVLGVSGGTIT